MAGPELHSSAEALSKLMLAKYTIHKEKVAKQPAKPHLHTQIESIHVA